MISLELEAALNLLIRRDADSRKIWRQTNLFTTTVTDMQPYGLRSRSVNPLPPLYHHSLGPFLQIFGEDESAWTVSTPKQQAGRSGRYGWLEDGHLVVSQEGITELGTRFLPQPHKAFDCQSELDVLLPVPDHLQEDLKNVTVQKLVAAPIQVPDDTYSNQNSLDKQGPRAERA